MALSETQLKMCERIMKLMSLAKEETNSSAHERESAQRMAAKLMSENDLTFADLRNGKIKDGYFKQFDLLMERDQCDWEAFLSRAIADAFDVRVIQRHSPWTLMYCGSQSDIDLSVWFFKHIRRSIGIQAEREWRKQADRKTFCFSATNEIARRMTELYKAKEEFSTSDSRALVVVKQTGLQEFVKNQFPNLSYKKAPKSNGSYAAHLSGQAAGKSISITRPVGHRASAGAIA